MVAVGTKDVIAGSALVDDTSALEPVVDAVIAAKIISGAVQTSKLADGAVTAQKISDASVQTAKLGVDSVSAAKRLAGAVETSKLADGAVTSTKIAPGAVSQLGSPDGSPLTALQVNTNGLVGVGTSGTLNPQVSLDSGTPTALTVGQGSWMRIYPIRNTSTLGSNVAIGNWS